MSTRSCSIAVACLLMAVSACRATGYYGPDSYLESGGRNVTGSPEFYWDVELQRLSSAFRPPEKLHLSAADKQQNSNDNGESARPTYEGAISTADAQDFADALKTGRIRPADPAAATREDQAARDFIAAVTGSTADPLPAEFASEFADYHAGACAYRLGKDRWADARKAWEALLQRPAEERHYRSVWAAFMLGKLAMKSGDYAAAVKYFQQTRELAQQGFADSLGMAADSYGWEGRCEWKQNHPEKAAPLFLTQLALGDESAVISLKALIPDRSPIEGMLNYGPEPDPSAGRFTDRQRQDMDHAAMAGLRMAARDPGLRKLVTVHILATASYMWSADLEPENTGTQRCQRWLKVIADAHLDHVEEAEYLGWVAYNGGDYNDAARWLAMANPKSPASCWLRAKLQLRAGKTAEAAASMAQAWRSIHELSRYTGVPPFQDEDGTVSDSGSEWTFQDHANGDFAALRLVRGQFVEALDTFQKGGANLWDDAAYIAERVLTADELKAYVDTLPPGAPQPYVRESIYKPEPVTPGRLRYLLGRRLVREDRYDEAAKYLPASYAKVLAVYAKALKDGANAKLPAEKRARAWFTAAWFARYDGMELMGTEGAPDGFISCGDFEEVDLAAERRSGVYKKIDYDNQGHELETTAPVALKPSKEERRRLARNPIHPDIRWHYRLVAGALAMRAAALLPDNTEELADVVNMAGIWVKDRDEKTGDKYYQVIDHRAARTKIGQADLARHWFTDQTGPWSEQAQADYIALHKEAGIQDPAQ